MAQKIASFDPLAVRRAKYAIIKGLDMSLHDGLELKKGLILKRRHSSGEMISATE